MTLSLIASIVALIFGIIILIFPRILNYLIAFYLIIIGVIGIINALDDNGGVDLSLPLRL